MYNWSEAGESAEEESLSPPPGFWFCNVEKTKEATVIEDREERKAFSPKYFDIEKLDKDFVTNENVGVEAPTPQYDLTDFLSDQIRKRKVVSTNAETKRVRMSMSGQFTYLREPQRRGQSIK